MPEGISFTISLFMFHLMIQIDSQRTMKIRMMIPLISQMRSLRTRKLMSLFLMETMNFSKKRHFQMKSQFQKKKIFLLNQPLPILWIL